MTSESSCSTVEEVNVSCSTVLSSIDDSDVVVNSRGTGYIYGRPIKICEAGSWKEALELLKKNRAF